MVVRQRSESFPKTPEIVFTSMTFQTKRSDYEVIDGSHFFVGVGQRIQVEEGTLKKVKTPRVRDTRYAREEETLVCTRE